MSSDEMHELVDELATDKTKTRRQIEIKIEECLQKILEDLKNEASNNSYNNLNWFCHCLFWPVQVSGFAAQAGA